MTRGPGETDQDQEHGFSQRSDMSHNAILNVLPCVVKWGRTFLFGRLIASIDCDFAVCSSNPTYAHDRPTWAEYSAHVGWGFVFRLISMPCAGDVHMATDNEETSIGSTRRGAGIASSVFHSAGTTDRS